MSRSIISALVVLVGFLGGPVFAEDLHCSLIEDSTKRDACYVSSATTEPTEKPKDWLLLNSKYFDSVTLSKSADHEVMCGEKIGSVTMVLICKEKQASFYISTSCAMGKTGDEHTVSVQVDDQSPVEETLVVPNNKFVLRQGDDAEAARFMASLIGGTTVNVRISPPAAPPFTSTFTIVDIEEKIQPLRDACGW